MKLNIVVPCFNEEDIFPSTVQALDQLLAGMKSEGLVAADSTLIFVDDGSRDSTWSLIEAAARANPALIGVRLSRNRGHQNACLAGFEVADGDIVITIDADLQDDTRAIVDMVKAAAGGADIVYGVRKKRTSDSFFKRFTAEGYYRILSALSVEIVFNHADFRLLSRRALIALFQFNEVNLFLRGIIPQLGFNTAVVYYDRLERTAGESKYPLRKMLSLAWQGITSFSTAPLKTITVLGLVLSLISLAVSFWAVLTWLFTSRTVPGWTSTIVPISLLGGVQLLCLGVIGEYLGKIYLEVKGRPRYFIAETVRKALQSKAASQDASVDDRSTLETLAVRDRQEGASENKTSV